MKTLNFWDFKTEYKFLKKKKLFSKIDKTLTSGKLFFGNELETFEKNFLKFNNSSFGLAVKNGTDALILSIRALGIKEGDEIITVSLTAIPTISAIVSTGAKPVFVDVNEDCLINTKDIEKKITRRTKAIIPVHLYGKVCNMSEIIRISKKNNLKIIEDCAQSLGAKYKKKNCGNFGDFGCFSFYPTKILGAYGDGGFIVCKSKKKLSILKQLSFYGLETKNINHKKYGKYYSNIHGYNSRIDNIQASILNLKLSFLKDWIKKRQKIAKKYFEKLFEKKNFNRNHVYHLFVIKTFKRQKLINYLKKKKILTGIHYENPIHSMAPYRKFEKNKKYLSNSKKFSKQVLSLPMHPFLKNKDVERIIKKVEFFKKNENDQIRPTI